MQQARNDGNELSYNDTLIIKRMWEVIWSNIALTKYYFAYCEAGFATKTLGDVIVTVARENTMALLDNC